MWVKSSREAKYLNHIIPLIPGISYTEYRWYLHAYMYAFVKPLCLSLHTRQGILWVPEEDAASYIIDLAQATYS
jgi:hypothetical protein